MNLREATRRDVEGLLELLDRLNANGRAVDPRFRVRQDMRALQRDHLREAWFGRFLPFPACWVAEQEAGLHGFVSGLPQQAHPVLEAPPTARIENLWVDPEFRRQGIATALVQRFRAAAANAGYARCEVSTLARDDQALAFWRAQGFSDLRVALAAEEL